ncbi:MAG: Hint domain-containing protein [Pseudomonadota bacterium]
MLLTHDTSFATFTPVCAPVPAFAPGTLFETEFGWMPVEHLTPGDKLATIDGGFKPLSAVTRTGSSDDPVWTVPGGMLGTCSDLTLNDAHYLAIGGRACHRLFGVPLALAPVSALAGYQGVARRPSVQSYGVGLRMAEEEVLWTQTGARVLVQGETPERHYLRLTYGQTRAVLLMMSPSDHAPDLAA